MAVGDIVPVPGVPFEETLTSASPDLLREMIKGFAQRMMDAEVEGICGAAYGEVSPERVNSRNGYRRREWDTRAGTVELAVPKLRQGTYYPEWLLERRRRAERALATELLEPAEPDQALAALDTALSHDAYNEYLYQRIMRIQAAAGRPDAVRRTLRLLETRLTELGLTPAAQTRQAAATLLGMPGSPQRSGPQPPLPQQPAPPGQRPPGHHPAR